MKKRITSNDFVEHSIHHSLRPAFNHLKSKTLVIKDNRHVFDKQTDNKRKFNSFTGYSILILAVLSFFFSISLSYSSITGFISNDSSGFSSSLIGVLLFFSSVLGFYLYLMRER